MVLAPLKKYDGAMVSSHNVEDRTNTASLANTPVLRGTNTLCGSHGVTSEGRHNNHPCRGRRKAGLRQASDDSTTKEAIEDHSIVLKGH